MFIHSKKDACPMCGVPGKELALAETGDTSRNCPSCKTVYNKFGVILSFDDHREELEFN